MGLLWERRDQAPGAFPVLFCHDEIVVECDVGQADTVKDWLRRAMVEAMAPLIDPVPVEVEVKVGQTWVGD
jgi:DNA polymerase I